MSEELIEFTTPLSKSTEMLPMPITCGFHPLWNLALCLLSVINVLMGSKKCLLDPMNGQELRIRMIQEHLSPNSSPLHTCSIHLYYRVWHMTGRKKYTNGNCIYVYAIQRGSNLSSETQVKIPKEGVGHAWVGCPSLDQPTVARIWKGALIEICALPSSNQL